MKNHSKQLVSVDFFTVPTALFQVLFAFIVIDHDRRRLVHFNVTAHPTAEWTAQQIVEAFPFDTAPKHLLRGRDRIYGEVTTPILNQNLMSHQHGLGNYGAAARLTEADSGDDQMQKKSENVAHFQDRIKLKKRRNPGRLRNSPRTRCSTAR